MKYWKKETEKKLKQLKFTKNGGNKMAETKQKDLMVRDIVEPVKDLNGLIKDNCITWFELSTSLWEENLKVLSTQLDMYLSWQENYIKTIREVSEKFSNELIDWNRRLKPVQNQTDKHISFQKDYADFAKKTSDKMARELITFNQRTMETAFTAFDNFVESLK